MLHQRVFPGTASLLLLPFIQLFASVCFPLEERARNSLLAVAGMERGRFSPGGDCISSLSCQPGHTPITRQKHGWEAELRWLNVLAARKKKTNKRIWTVLLLSVRTLRPRKKRAWGDPILGVGMSALEAISCVSRYGCSASSVHLKWDGILSLHLKQWSDFIK